MRRRTKWILAGVAAVASVILASKRSLRGLVVLHLGDSHVGGLERPLRTLVSASGGRYQDHFRVGISTPQASRAGWGAIVARAAPDIVLVTLGTNDHPSDGYAASVGALMDEIRAAAPRAGIIWWGPPVLLRRDLLELPDELVRLQRPEVLRRGGRYVDSRPYTSLHAPDGVHLTRAGYEKWARSGLRTTFWVS